jgi:ABC-type phosphate transport system substrate-binding protein
VGGILAIFHTQALAQKMDYQLAGNLTGVKELSLKEVKDIFKGRRTFWANGEEMLIGLPSSKAPHAELVASSIFGTTVNGMQKYWLSLVFQGRGKSPQFFSSPEEMMQWIQNNPGAIGIFPLGYPIPNANLIRIKP